MGKKNFVWLASFCLLLSVAGVGLCAPRASHDHEWVWNVPVFPPEGGWEGEAGQSVRAAFTWHEAEISDSGGGVGGHDLHFVYLPVLDESSALAAPLPIDARTAAVMSFSTPEVDRVLIERMAGRNVPLFLAGGESLLIDRGGRPILNIFALDLFRDYRCEAFALYAKKTLNPEAHLGLAASRFTVDQEREAKICYTFLDEAGFMPMPFWVDASVRDSFRMMSQEVESAADGVVISFLGSMGSREIWRNFMRLRTTWKLWNCAAPDTSYLSSRGMVFADQNLFLMERGGFSELKRRLWNTRVMQVTDIVSAGRADALTEWLKRAIDSLSPQPIDKLSYPALLQALERVRGIPFGSQKLDIRPELHRPAVRQVYIAEVRNREYFMLDSLPVHGLVYTPGY
ncbi:MAG: hypothetical protein IJU98_04675 [Synergistaceae bacterium]|nr:hypothetical protein [Synergistaceae bacterium]